MGAKFILSSQVKMVNKTTSFIKVKIGQIEAHKNSYHFADDISICILKEKFCISIQTKMFV